MEFQIIVNPAGASGAAWRMWKRLEPVMKDSGCGYVLHRSSEKRGITDICRELTSRGEQTAIILIGGDGTGNDAVNGIADFEKTAMGFIPCGTGNDLFRDMDLPRRAEKLLSVMLDGCVKHCADIGVIKCEIGGETVTRRFNISTDIGFGAATCAYVNKSRIKALFNRLGIGRAVYLVEALKVCFTSEPVPVAVSCGGRTRLYRKCLSVIAMNHSYEGGGFKFCPDAKFDDGKLDLCIGNGLTKAGFLRMLPRAYLGRHMKLKGLYGERTERVILKSGEPMWIHTDGEVLGKTKYAEIGIIPEKLRMLF